jgi:hypothetical protein
MKMALILAAVSLVTISYATAETVKKDKGMNIVIETDGKTVVFGLNDSGASKDLLYQLPLTVKFEDFGGKEKIFYPPKKLRTQGTSLANAKAGTLAYYEPWGDVVLFYEDFGSAPGLYELGKAVSGAEFIGALRGSAWMSVSSDS